MLVLPMTTLQPVVVNGLAGERSQGSENTYDLCCARFVA
jgi:hypothetical protein